MAVSAFAGGSRQDENGDGRLGPLEETVTRIAARIGYFHQTIATLVDHFVAAQPFAIFDLRYFGISESQAKSKRQGDFLRFFQTLYLKCFLQTGDVGRVERSGPLPATKLEAQQSASAKKSAILIGLPTANRHSALSPMVSCTDAHQRCRSNEVDSTISTAFVIPA
jgi:hypothetical protein